MCLSLKMSLMLISIVWPSYAMTCAATAPSVPTTDSAPGPFDFREAYLLERKIQLESKGQKYDPNHSENTMSRMNYGLANPFAQAQADKRGQMSTYQGMQWVSILPETDQYRSMGGLDLAEKQYLDIVKRLSDAQGPSSNHLSLMLDHLAEFYLEERRFNEAYKTFTEAVTIQRQVIDKYSKGGVPASSLSYGASDPSATLESAQLHLSDLLTRLGQLDLGSGNLNSANTTLTEAVAIINSAGNARHTDGLYAVYFLSKLFERQSKWKEAEGLWKQTVQLREKFDTGVAYWDAQREMAAFYARHSDFHTAAGIVRDIQARSAGKELRYENHDMLLNNRNRFERYDRYSRESAIAMSEILAVDAWQTQGADAAAALLKDPVDAEVNGWVLDNGSGAERTEMLAWFQTRIFLHMSILLDGNPSQARIDKAYTLLCKVKGRYLAALGEATRHVESMRGNPGVQIPDFTILDQLGAVRENQARLFLDSALDGKQLDNVAFSANDNRERVLSNAILSSTAALNAHPVFSLPLLMKAVPVDAAFIDFFIWDRAAAKAPSRREYGAFVLRNNQPIQFVRLDTAVSIDGDIDVLQLRKETKLSSAPTAQTGTQRATSVAGKRVDDKSAALTFEQFQQRSNALYKKVMAPLESDLNGATRLYIVPDGKLALAPISALRDNSGNYVLESRAITYMGSSRDMARSVILGSARPASSEIVANPDFNLSLYGGTRTTAALDRCCSRLFPVQTRRRRMFRTPSEFLNIVC